jgi:hypothetical protein
LPIEATTKARLARSMIALKIGVERPVGLARYSPERSLCWGSFGMEDAWPEVSGPGRRHGRVVEKMHLWHCS